MNVLLFDIDGTLNDAGGAGQAAMEDALAQEFGAKGPVHGIPTAGRTDRAIAMDRCDGAMRRGGTLERLPSPVLFSW